MSDVQAAIAELVNGDARSTPREWVHRGAGMIDSIWDQSRVTECIARENDADLIVMLRNAAPEIAALMYAVEGDLDRDDVREVLDALADKLVGTP